MIVLLCCSFGRTQPRGMGMSSANLYGDGWCDGAAKIAAAASDDDAVDDAEIQPRGRQINI